MNRIIDTSGNIYEYNQDNGLISRNDIILSGAEYEPVFVSYPDNSEPPIFVGILSRIKTPERQIKMYNRSKQFIRYFSCNIVDCEGGCDY